MTGHSSMVGSGECGTCHQSLSVLFPVSIDTSAGAQGLSPTSCVGCHGRDQDAGHDGTFPGRGAGLRQHHFRAGVLTCSPCHADADPASYTPVGENIKPANYFTPDAAHPDKPTDPCNANGSESKFGPTGLDNDGNGIYDLADPACAPVVTPTSTATPTVALVPTATATPPPTAMSTPRPCVGDCSGNSQVTVDEILTMVNIALGNTPVTTCEAGDANHDGQITVDEILTAVNNALNGCPARICGGIAGLPCGTDEVCDLRDSTCLIADLVGTCVNRPGAYPEIYDPVCGCDAVTYSNECLRLAAGATLAHVGECR